jgi:hypothetical protein
MEHYKTISFFTYPSDYAIFRLLLDQHEIRYAFVNETMISLLPFHSNAIGGIQLKVHPEDLEEATRLLQDWNGSSHLHIV